MHFGNNFVVLHILHRLRMTTKIGAYTMLSSMQWIDKGKVEQLICIYAVLGSSLRFSDYIDRSIAVCIYIIFTWYI